MYDNAKLDSMLNLKGYDEKAYFFMLDGDQNITYTNQSDDKFSTIFETMKKSL